MRKMFGIMASICAASFASGANARPIDWQIFSEPFVTPAHAQDVNWQEVDDALGRKPAVSGDVHRYGFPRSDLSVTLDGVTIKPALALGGWVAFKPMQGEAVVMGDPRFARDRNQSSDAQADRRRTRDHRRPQSPAARQSRDVLYACRRPRRPGQDGGRHS